LRIQPTTTLTGPRPSTGFRIRKGANARVRRGSAFLELASPPPIVRYAYYTFILAIPFESLGWEVFSLSKVFGYLLLAVALCHQRACFSRRPKALWYFAIYLCILVSSILQEPQYLGANVMHILTMAQLIILFWISYNLMRSERVRKGTLLTLAASTFFISSLNVLNITAAQVQSNDVRFSALQEDPNSFAAVLSLGLLALVGLAYGQKVSQKQVGLVVKLVFIFFAVSIVQTGSRGVLASLLVGLSLLILKRGDLVVKFKVGLAGLLAVLVFIGLSYQYEPVRERWERTFTGGQLAGREEIFSLASKMFLERPLFGWGPQELFYELGYRDHSPSGRKGPHNSYLYILLEVGLLGATFFFGGMWLCALAVWKARDGPQGIVPLAMLSCLFAIDMSLVWHARKLHWIVLAYALASASYVVSSRLRRKTVPHGIDR